MKEQDSVFDAVVPVFLDWDNNQAIGAAKGYRDPETGNIHVDIEFNAAASSDLQRIFQLISTKAISFAGAPKLDAEVARKPAVPVRDICGAWADPHTNVTCCLPKGHSGPHERPRL